jgi:cell division protein FtsI (penicillin-binding protein 3)
MTPAGPPRTPTRGRRPASVRPADHRRGAVARRPRAEPYLRPRPAARGIQRPPAIRRRVGKPSRRLVAVLALMLLCFTGVVVRLVQVQVVSPGSYVAFGAAQRFQRITLPADRGSIFDRNGEDLAVSIPQRTVWADPRLIQDPSATAEELRGLLSLDASATTALTAKLASGKAFTYVARRVADPLADAVAKAKLPGIFLLDEPKRFDPSGDLARSVLGQVGVDNDGLSGLELKYDRPLTGTPGSVRVERDPDGRTIPAGEQQLVPAKRGDDLVLTLRSWPSTPRAARPSSATRGRARSWPSPTSPSTRPPARCARSPTTRPSPPPTNRAR